MRRLKTTSAAIETDLPYTEDLSRLARSHQSCVPNPDMIAHQMGQKSAPCMGCRQISRPCIGAGSIDRGLLACLALGAATASRMLKISRAQKGVSKSRRRYRTVPLWVVSAAAAVFGLLARVWGGAARFHAFARFLLIVSRYDAVGECCGTRRLADYFQEQVAKSDGRPATVGEDATHGGNGGGGTAKKKDS